MGNVFHPAMDMVDDALLDKVDDDFVKPKKLLLKRVASKFHARKIPKELRDFDFKVCVI